MQIFNLYAPTELTFNMNPTSIFENRIFCFIRWDMIIPPIKLLLPHFQAYWFNNRIKRLSLSTLYISVETWNAILVVFLPPKALVEDKIPWVPYTIFPGKDLRKSNLRLSPRMQDISYNRQRGKRNVLVTTFLPSNNGKNNKAVHKIDHDKALKIKSVLKSSMQ